MPLQPTCLCSLCLTQIKPFSCGCDKQSLKTPPLATRAVWGVLSNTHYIALKTMFEIVLPPVGYKMYFATRLFLKLRFYFPTFTYVRILRFHTLLNLTHSENLHVYKS